VEGHKRHHVPIGRAWHGLASRDNPLNGLGEGRQLARLNEMKELLAGDVRARLVRHLANKVLDRLQVRAATVLWTRKSSEHIGREREEEEAEEKAEPQTRARCAPLKGTGLTPRLRCWAHRVSRTPAHSRAPRRNNRPLA
jgi:hypothetical protein